MFRSSFRIPHSAIRIRILPGLLAAGLLCGVAFAAPQGTGPAPAGVRVAVETTDGKTLEGHLVEPTLRIETDFGVLDLNILKVKSIDFARHDDKIEALVELSDKCRIHGRTTTPTLRLESGDIPMADIRELRTLHKPDTSLVAVIIGLVTLTALEIVLGIDNIIFLAIVAGRLPVEQQPRARKLGLAAALGTRLLLLFSLSFLLGLTKPVFQIPLPGLSPEARDVSWRDIILIVGGGFLIVKSVREMHEKFDETRERNTATASGKLPKTRQPAGFVKTIVLISLIDILFSLDSVITAVGMIDIVWVMATAMIIAMGVMLLFADAVAKFVEANPTIKMLALSFLILIGVLLAADGLGQHIDKGYVYFAMAFAVVIELVNMKLRPKAVADMVCDA